MVKKISFKRKVTVGMLILLLGLTIENCFIVGWLYAKKEYEDSTELAYNYAKTAAEYIDGDKIHSYIEWQKEDDYYWQIKKFLDCTYNESNDIKYYCVFVPYDDDLMYLWASGEDVNFSLGSREGYSSNDTDALFNMMDGDVEEKAYISKDDVYGHLLTAYYPIYDSSGNVVAISDVDVDMSYIKADIKQFSRFIAIGIFIVVVLSIIIVSAVLEKHFLAPILRLNDATKSIVGDMESCDYKTRIEINTGDEIQELAESFNRMVVEIKDYIVRITKITADKQQIESELNVATQIQADMLPCIFPAFPDRQEIDIYATMTPAKEVGGDFYDFFFIDKRHLAMVMADVSGKGVPAALFMVIGKTLIKDHTKPNMSLGEVFTEVNQLLCESNKEGLFITAFECVLDLATGEMRFVNAGHDRPYIMHNGEDYIDHEVSPGFILALMEGMEYEEGSVTLSPGDKLFLYTDGVTEATNGDEKLYGFERLSAVLNKNKDKNPEELLAEVKKDVDAFVGEAPQFDDITMLCMEYKERMNV